MEILSKEELILRSIFEDFIIQSKVADKIEPLIFKDKVNIKLAEKVQEFIKKYKKFPLATDLFYTLSDDSDEKIQLVKIMSAQYTKPDRKIIYDEVQNFFRDRKTLNTLIEASQLLYENKLEDMSSIVKKLQGDVNFSLNTTTGLNATKDAQEVIDRLSQLHTSIPSAFDALRFLTGTPTRSGGYMRKALSIYQGQPNIGKTIILCNEAAFAYQKGYNVLYVTLELAEEYILQRIYSAVTDIEYQKIPDSSAEEITRLFKERREKDASVGNIYVKFLPGSTSTTLDIDNIINEIKITEGVTLDFIVVDYLGKMKPVKRKDMINFSHTLYSVGSDVSEQLRDLAVMHGIAILSASQVTRDGYDSNDPSMKHTAGSAGINDTGDLIIRITQDPDLKQLNLFLCYILKNRFGPNGKSFILRCDYAHMRIEMASPKEYKKYQDEKLNKEKTITGFTIIDPSQISIIEINNKNAILVESPENELEVINKHELIKKSDIFNIINPPLIDKITNKEMFTAGNNTLFTKDSEIITTSKKNEILLNSESNNSQIKKDPFADIG